MAVKEMLKETEQKMTKTIEATKREFATLRTGRASAALVEGIMVDYYGTPTPLKKLAAINTPDVKSIAIQPWDPGSAASIEKAIMKSALGITPVNDGKLIRINIPPLTQERRQELVKVAKKMAEEGKVSLRTVRRDANEAVKKQEKEKKISEDESHSALDDILELTRKYEKQADEALAAKEKEINEF